MHRPRMRTPAQKYRPTLQAAAICALAALLAGCQGSPVYYHKSPLRHVVVLDKREISVLPLDDNRWEAYGGKQGGLFASDMEAQRNRQIQAIEKVSGCKVTTAVYPPDQSDEHLLMQAVVDCSARLGG